jgi:hypothetical protein
MSRLPLHRRSPLLRFGPFYGHLIESASTLEGHLHYKDTPETRHLKGDLFSEGDPVEIVYHHGEKKWVGFICMYFKMFDTVDELEDWYHKFGYIEWRNIPERNWMTPLRLCLAEIMLKYGAPRRRIYHIPYRHDYIG